jgi:Secretion system C-terminal sorting domain
MANRDKHYISLIITLISLVVFITTDSNLARATYSNSSTTTISSNNLLLADEFVNHRGEDSELQEGILNDTTYGLVFEKEFEFKLENTVYTDIIQLIGLDGKAFALQFRLSLNKSVGDSTILIFENIQKGSDVIDSTWLLVYNAIQGDTNSIGASRDEVYVLLYNMNQDSGLDPGDYSDLLKVNYRVADLPVWEDSIKSSLKITHTQASTFEGFPIDITPSREEFSVVIVDHITIPKYGIVFALDSVYQLEDDSYTDIIQLKDLAYKAQAIQFRLLVNQSLDDNVILTFQNLQKGMDVIDPGWVLNYNVIRGDLTGNGASKDEIFVLLYNLNQNSGLNPGTYNDLINVTYRVANLQANEDSIKSSFLISNAEASTFEGFPIDITPSRNEFKIIAKNRVGYYGDLNNDGCLDILDVLMMVNHISGRDSLDADVFPRADIAPWTLGNDQPDPDGFVNVLDLSLLQNIILSGFYPDGTSVNGCNVSLSKLNAEAESRLTLYVNNDRITVYLNCNVDIRGVQIDFSGVSDNSEDMVINTDLGQGYYLQTEEMLKVLLYDRRAEKILKAGENMLADMPFPISNPENITIENFILIDNDMQKIVENQMEIIYENPPSLPLKYQLQQNYPNPFNPSTKIRYQLAGSGVVSLKVYDILGNEVAVLVDEEKVAGEYEVEFIASKFTSGVYFYRLIINNFIETKKMVLLQ